METIKEVHNHGGLVNVLYDLNRDISRECIGNCLATDRSKVVLLQAAKKEAKIFFFLSTFILTCLHDTRSKWEWERKRCNKYTYSTDTSVVFTLSIAAKSAPDAPSLLP